MALFTVNRYLGVEDDGSVSEQSSSQTLLTKLQQKAKKTQKTTHKESLQEQITQEGVKKKRRVKGDDGVEQRPLKKKKSNVLTLCELDSENKDDPVEEKKKKKNAVNERLKKKKQKPTEPLENGKDGHEGPAKSERGFRAVGEPEAAPVRKVHQVLPQWLAQPDVIHKDIKNNLVPVSDIAGLSEPLVQKLQNNGIHHFFPVQAEVIPAILEQGMLHGRGGYKPRDICVSAPTGSGKTLSFVLPVIQVLMERVVCEVRALVVLPTKELAQQVCKVFTTYAEGTSLKVVMVAGQRSFAAEQASLSKLRQGKRQSLADIVVATQGRLVDHINKSPGLCLEHVRFLIIDEADRMIDGMHQSWLSQVEKAVYGRANQSSELSTFSRSDPAHITAASLSPPQMPLQKLLFSATLTQNPEKLQQLSLHQPRLFSSIHRHSNIATPAAPALKQDGFDFPQGLTEHYVPCTLSRKPLLILHFVLRMKLSPILCFTNSRETAHRLCLLVQLFGGIDAAEFSSRLSPGERKKTLKEFEQGKIQLLVSTDAAARGIDINKVKSVVNYDAPQYIRTYIHRIGRTARAGKSGLAFTFLLKVQEKNFLQMVTEAGSPGIQRQIVKPENLQSLEARYEVTLQKLAKMLKDEKVK